jgi:leader peptidase (prepilin peptidase)/N-methyltransferase
MAHSYKLCELPDDSQSESPALNWLWPLLVAPFAGSFLGVVIRRLPEGTFLTLSRSACDSCAHVLGPRDLVPFASWLAARGRCRFCGSPVAVFYPIVELAALLVAGCALCVYADVPTLLWTSCALGWVLLALAWIDWEHYRLPDELTLPLLVAGLLATFLMTPPLLADHALATVLGYLCFRALSAAYRRLREQEGLGAGDAKLFAACGAWVGLGGLSLVLILASATGLLLAALRVYRGERLTRTTPLPFGTCLALALWIAWLVPGWR